MILLGIFVFAVVLPLALKVVGITLGIIIGLAVLLIKVAVTLAIGYLFLSVFVPCYVSCSRAIWELMLLLSVARFGTHLSPSLTI